MKILQYIDSLQVGGAERMLVNIANSLADKGFEVVVVSSRTSGTLETRISEGIKIYILEKKRFTDFRAFQRLKNIVEQFKPDVIHAHSASIYWGVILKTLSTNKSMLIFHDHYGMSENLKIWSRPLLRLVSLNIDKIIVVNDRLLHWWTRICCTQDKTFLISNFSFLDMPSRSVERNFIQIVCLANLRPQKNHLMLISAFNKIVRLKSDINIRLVLAGKIDNLSCHEEILKAIHGFGLEEKVDVLGAVDRVEELLSQSDIGVLSSMSEGLPVSLLEYGLAGLPVVVTDVGQCSVVLEQGKYGLLVSPLNVNEFCDSICFLIDNREVALRLGNSFRDHVISAYGVQDFLRDYEKIIAI